MAMSGGRVTTSILPTRDGAIEYLRTGSGEPVTVLGHGLAGSIATTRPFGSAVSGTKVYLHFRGHGASSSPESPWTYRALGAELRAVADHVDATQALGISMGAGAICAALEEQPSRFDKIVLVLPAVIDQPRHDSALERLVAMGQHAQDHDSDAVAELLLLEQPAEHRDEEVVRNWCREQARVIVQTDVSRALRTIPYATAVGDRASLAQVTAQTLLICQEADPAHPVWVAGELAEVLPNAQLEVLPPGGIMWTHRARVRSLVGEFLS